MKNKPRLYEPIWQIIKKEKICVISISHPALAARVKKAVIKEKDQDRVFKLLNENDEIRLVICYDVKNKQMTFRLKQKLGIEDIVT